MSGPDRKMPDDELLERYLDGHSELSRAYRQTSAPPSPAELDRRILELARSELQSAAPAAPRRGLRWRYPFAAAAVIVLSFGVLINLQRENALQTAVPAVAPAVPAQRQLEAREAERAPEDEASADAVAERPAVEARAAGAPPDAATSVTAAPPPAPAAAPAAAPAQAPVAAPLLQQKAERDAEQKRRSEQESARKRFAAEAPPAMMRPQAAAADSAGLAAPAPEETWSCQAPDAQWVRIRRLFEQQRPEQARAAYRELDSACPDIDVPEDLRGRFGEMPKADSPER